MAKTVEIDETQYLAQQRVTGIMQSMLGNPKARELLTQAAKIVDPKIATPELDAKAEVLAEVHKERDARLALEQRIAADAEARDLADRTREFSQSWDAKKARLRSPAGGSYTDAGITEIERLATERGIIDLEAAAALFDKLHPPAAVAQPGGYGGLDAFQQSARDDEDFKKLFEANGDDPAAERNMINKALTEFRSGGL